MLKKIAERKIFRNSYVFAIITRAGGILLGLVYTIVLSRYLGPALRGEYSVILNYANIIAAVFGAGICFGYPYSKRNNPENSGAIFKSYVGNVTALFCVYLVVFLLLAFLLPIPKRIKFTLVTVPVVLLYSQLRYLVLIEEPKAANLADLILGTFDLVFIVFLMLFTEANYALCIFFLISDRAVHAGLALRNTKCNSLKTCRFDKKFAEYVSFGFLPMLTDLLTTFNYKVDIVMLSLFKNVSTAEIGIYSVGVMLAEKMLLLPDVMSNILQSKLAEGKKEEEVAKICRFSFWITIVCLIGVAIVGKQFILLAFGAEYAGAYQVTLIVLSGIVGMVLCKVTYSYNLVMGNRKRNFVPLLISVCINIILNGLFISIYGCIGAAYASLISFIICGTMFLTIFCKKTGTPFYKMFLPEASDFELIRSLLHS